MSTDTQSQSGTIDSTLNETELGRFIASYKVPMAILVVLVISGIFGYGIVTHNKDKKTQEAANRLFRFKESQLADYEAEKIATTDLVKAYQGVMAEVGHQEVAVPTVLNYSDILIDRGEADYAVQALESSWNKLNSGNSYLVYMLGRRLAVAYENNGKDKEALQVLEFLNEKGIRFLEESLYLDLGRLSLKMGDKETAKRNFDYILDTGKDANVKRIAELYLEKL